MQNTFKTRGLRNNNPGNIRINNELFLGEVQPSQDNSFKQFSDMQYGYRAIFVILGTYLSRGVNTISKIISCWAPENENNTESYISTVEKQSGIHRNQVLTSYSRIEYIKIVAAISFVENGIKPDLNDIENGFKLQEKIKG